MYNVGGDIIIAQDDDDIFAPRAFEVIREAALEFPDRPIMARVKTPFLGVLWTQPLTPPFDGHCLISPNNKHKLGYWSADYAGDQTYIKSTLEQYNNIGWLDKVVAITRPTWKLWSKPVKTYDEAEVVRKIRNSGREFMTKERNEITAKEQEDWWTHLDGNSNWIWLFFDEDWKVIGYVYLRKGDKTYASYCLIPKARGKGYGKELVEFSQWAAQEELVIEVLESNDRAIKLYRKMGFKEHWTRDGIMEMYSEWPPSTPNSEGPVINRDKII
jgi:Acetyltransferases